MQDWTGPPGEMHVDVQHETSCPCAPDDQPDDPDRCDCEAINVRFSFYKYGELQ
jgi:hypothetical protein